MNPTHTDAFTEARNALLTCALDEEGIAAQRERQRRLAPGVRNLVRDPEAVLVEFNADFDRQALQEMVAVEEQCCPFFAFAFAEKKRRLTITVKDPEELPALDAIYHAMRAARGQGRCAQPATDGSGSAAL